MNFPITQEMKDFFHNQKIGHVQLVNEFAHKYDNSLSFPEHDSDKFREPQLSLLAPHIWYEFHPNFEWRSEWDVLEKQGKDIHKTTNPHHPEFWKDISKMTEYAMIEMVCDICAVAASGRPRNTYFGDAAALEWYKSVAVPKYKFTSRQQKFIKSVFARIIG